ncbi:MAG: relaxase/mobilization nuclease domain-containing protein [Gemmatimonadetes bacterium]|nr:relaxase/mobilization nuclease domain-containing protein [Gemmatimonadota bacterium]MYJ12115.1 relaxase/mobilization nuclease domain-containing protein [Gemmatimonadota bacterium]
MVPKVHQSGRSFRGVTEYCLNDKRPDPKPRDPDAPRQRREQDEDNPSWTRRVMSERVAWTQTLNLSTDDPYKAARAMAATADYSQELKQLAGIRNGGRRLEKPVCHYSLAWREGENPDRATMVAAARSSLVALKMQGHQALVVAHHDSKCAHVHVIVNRVSYEDGRAAKLSQSRLHLSRWAERYERYRGDIQCGRRVDHNRRRDAGEAVYDKQRQSAARYHRHKEISRQEIPDGRNEKEIVGAAIQRIHERRAWNKCQAVLEEGLERLDPKHTAAWSKLYSRQENEKMKLEADSNSISGRARVAVVQRNWRELYDAILGKEEVLSSWKADLDQHHRTERAELGRGQGQEAAELDRQAEAVYQREIAAPLPAEEVTREALIREIQPQMERLEAEGVELSSITSEAAPDPYELAREREFEIDRSRERGMDIPM